MVFVARGSLKQVGHEPLGVRNVVGDLEREVVPGSCWHGHNTPTVFPFELIPVATG